MANTARPGRPSRLLAIWHPAPTGSGTREERDRLLADAEVIVGGWPFPLDLRARARRLKWFHQRPAGASNLLKGDLWGSDVDRDNLARRRQHAGHRGIRHRRHPARRQGVPPRRPRPGSGRVQCPRLPAAAAGRQDRAHRRRRRHRARGRQAVRRTRHARRRHTPPPTAGRSHCRRASPSSVAQTTSTLPAGQRCRGDLLPMDAGDEPPVQPRPVRRDEGWQRAGQCRAR